MCMQAAAQASLPLTRALRWPQEWAASPFLPLRRLELGKGVAGLASFLGRQDLGL